MTVTFLVFLLFLIGKKRHDVGKKGGYLDWEWDRNSAPRERGKIPFKELKVIPPGNTITMITTILSHLSQMEFPRLSI